ncbi:MAG TPA: SLC13 family permease [Thermoanaerobaculia bacterium]
MTPLLLSFAILAAAVILFLSDRVRADLVALMVVVALGVSGVLTPEEAFSGFSRSAVITIFAIFILAAGLERTGVTQRVGDLLLRAGRGSEQRLVVIVMLAGAGLSLFMNNIAAASVLLPAVSGASRRAGTNPARLLMPLAFATSLGGMATLLTTTNIVVNSLLRDRGLRGFGLLGFAPLGLPIVAAGIAYMALWGRRMLPSRSPGEIHEHANRQEADLAEVYHLGEWLFRAGVPAGSPLAGKTLAGGRLRETLGLDVLAIEHEGRVLPAPPPDSLIEEEDILLLSGDPAGLKVGGELEILPGGRWRESDLESPSVVVLEAVLAPRSTLIGQTLRGSHFRERYGMTVLAVWRAGRSIRTGLSDLELHFGDGLLLQGDRSRLPVLRDEAELIVLDKGEENGENETPLAPGRSILALAVMLGGALTLVLIGVLGMDEASRAVEWKTVFLVAGMLPMGIAMTKTGAADLLTHGLIAILGGTGRVGLLAGLVALGILLTQVMHGAAVAAVLAPVAIQTAEQVGANPRAMAMGVALATSMAFLTPLGHPVNALVMGPGGYRFRDYFKIGLPLVLLLFAMIVALVPILFRL